MKVWGLLVSSAFFVAHGAIGYATDDAVKQMLDARYGELKSAMASHDPEAVGKVLAPGFSSVDIQGRTENAEQMLFAVNSLPADHNKVSKTTLESVVLVGNIANVKQTYHMTTIKTIKADRNAVNHNVELTTLSDDTWVLTEGQWFFLKTVTKDVAYLSDGKLVMHKTSP